MNKFVKKLLGIDKLEAARKAAEDAAAAALKVAEETAATAAKTIEEAKEADRIAALTPKERATEKKEPYFKVVDFHVNKDNPRFGFFELDWNEYHVAYCKSLGYFGETDEVVVDLWFTEYCRQIASQEGINMDRRASGFINVTNIGDGKSEVS
jgi:hypothetical protein